GYVEEEYLASGESDVYSWPADAPAVVRTQDAPYTTRVLVRRPADADDFSGNIVVEMLNPSNLFDLNIGWALAHEQMIANGDTWVGITAKPIAVDALKSFDADRYGDLSFANPLPLDDPANCETVAADSSRDTENGLVWDIYTQVGNWLRSDDATNPLTYGTGATEVSKAYGLGYSQTGG
ncbi:alpha/beta hydrolase domain-containing protein, partial [uncultured Pseudokineococcus sp.]